MSFIKLQLQTKTSKSADNAVAAIGSNIEELPSSAARNFTSLANEMESILFRGSSMRRVLGTLRSFEARPAIREAFHQSHVATMSNNQAIPGENKDKALHREMVRALKGFFAMFKKKRGRTCLEDQNAIDAAIAALTGSNITEQGLSSTLCRALGVSRRLLKRATQLRKDLEDRDYKHWVRVPRREYINWIKDGGFSSCAASCTVLCINVTHAIPFDFL
jgi:hypothetical protein